MSGETGGESYNLRASVVGIVVSIVLAGVANVWMLASWKGAQDARMGNLETQLATILTRFERTDTLSQRVSVIESRVETSTTELTRTRESIESLRVEIARASRPR